MEVQDNARKTDAKSRSSRTHTSKTSSVGSAALRARANAKAARAQLEYSRKEAAIMKQKSELEAAMMKQKSDHEANLHVLNCEKAVGIAEAEAAVYDEEEGFSKTEQRM